MAHNIQEKGRSKADGCGIFAAGWMLSQRWGCPRPCHWWWIAYTL